MTPVDAPPSLASRLAWSFLVGALAMLTFHQAGAGLFHAAGLFPVAPIKGQPVAFAQTWGSMLRIALVHAFWGLGMVIIWLGLREPAEPARAGV